MSWPGAKKYSPWLVLSTPDNKKIFIKKENVLGVSHVAGANLTGIIYYDDRHDVEITAGVCESLQEILWKLSV